MAGGLRDVEHDRHLARGHRRGPFRTTPERPSTSSVQLKGCAPGPPGPGGRPTEKVMSWSTMPASTDMDSAWSAVQVQRTLVNELRTDVGLTTQRVRLPPRGMQSPGLGLYVGRTPGVPLGRSPPGSAGSGTREGHDRTRELPAPSAGGVEGESSHGQSARQSIRTHRCRSCSTAYAQLRGHIRRLSTSSDDPGFVPLQRVAGGICAAQRLH